MNTKNWSFRAILLVVSLITGFGQAEAASLTGEGAFSFSGTVRIFGQAGVNSTGATSFDFLPPENGSPFGAFPDDSSEFVIDFNSATGGFSGFNSNPFPPVAGTIGTGEQQDITFQSLSDDNVIALSPPATPIDLSVNPINNFLILEGGDMHDTTLRLENAETANFEQVGNNLISTVQLSGTFISNNQEFAGSGTYTVNFVDITENEFFSGLVSGQVFTEAFSAQFVAEDNATIPESTSILSLAGAFGLAISSLRRKQRKE